MDASDAIPVNPEKWAQVLTDAFAALQEAKLRIDALERENAELKKRLAGVAVQSVRRLKRARSRFRVLRRRS